MLDDLGARVARPPRLAGELVFLAIDGQNVAGVDGFGWKEEGGPARVGQLALALGLVSRALLELDDRAYDVLIGRGQRDIAVAVIGSRRLATLERAWPVDELRERNPGPPE